MSTQSMELGHFTFDAIDERIRSLAEAPEAKAFPADADDPTQRLLTIYAAVRPVIAVVTALPLIPPAWREALRVFVAALDAIETAGASFKAGKDL